MKKNAEYQLEELSSGILCRPWGIKGAVVPRSRNLYEEKGVSGYYLPSSFGHFIFFTKGSLTHETILTYHPRYRVFLLQVPPRDIGSLQMTKKMYLRIDDGIEFR